MSTDQDSLASYVPLGVGDADAPAPLTAEEKRLYLFFGFVALASWNFFLTATGFFALWFPSSQWPFLCPIVYQGSWARSLNDVSHTVDHTRPLAPRRSRESPEGIPPDGRMAHPNRRRPHVTSFSPALRASHHTMLLALCGATGFNLVGTGHMVICLARSLREMLAPSRSTPQTRCPR